MACEFHLNKGVQKNNKTVGSNTLARKYLTIKASSQNRLFGLSHFIGNTLFRCCNLFRVAV